MSRHIEDSHHEDSGNGQVAEYYLERFLMAQSTPYAGYDLALAEIKNGRKVSHWIWYVFPQLLGLGHSKYSILFGIKGRGEAEAYLKHPVLGSRLREITNALLEHKGRYPESILGNIDAVKVKSCMTLFDCISPNDIFNEVLREFYDGKRDPRSLI